MRRAQMSKKKNAGLGSKWVESTKKSRRGLSGVFPISLLSAQFRQPSSVSYSDGQLGAIRRALTRLAAGMTLIATLKRMVALARQRSRQPRKGSSFSREKDGIGTIRLTERHQTPKFPRVTVPRPRRTAVPSRAPSLPGGSNSSPVPRSTRKQRVRARPREIDASH